MTSEDRVAVAGALLIFGPIIMMIAVPSQGLDTLSRVIGAAGALMLGVGGAIVARLVREQGREIERLRGLLQGQAK